MKIRLNYVSNSSSSSFILKNISFFNKIKKEDLYEALIELYDKNKYEDYIISMKKYNSEYVKHDYLFQPFVIFDLFDENDKNEAINQYSSLLEGWLSYSAYHINDKIDINLNNNRIKKWKKFIERLESKEDKNGYTCYVSETPEHLKYNRMHKFINNKYIEKPLTNEIINKYMDKWNELSLCTNKDVLLSPNARYFIHFQDNEVYLLKGITDENNKYESESYSFERLIEIIINKLIELNKIDNNINYKDMTDSLFTYCWHEG